MTSRQLMVGVFCVVGCASGATHDSTGPGSGSGGGDFKGGAVGPIEDAPLSIGPISFAGNSGLCLDDSDASTNNGTRIQLWQCNQTVAQSWTYTEAGKLEGPGGKCVTLADPTATVGTVAQLSDCTGAATQIFRWGNNQPIVPTTGVTGVCLGVVGPATSGSAVQVVACNANGNSWLPLGLVAGGVGNVVGNIVGAAGKCLDDNNAGTANGTKIQLWDCNSTAAQQWMYTDYGQITGPGGKCLDAANGSMDNGTIVQLYDCNGTAAQQWTWVFHGGPIWPLSGKGTKCVTTQGGTDDGTQVQIWDCDGAAGQLWAPPPAAVGATCPLANVTCYQGQYEWSGGTLVCTDNGPGADRDTPNGTSCGGPGDFASCEQGSCVPECHPDGASCVGDSDCCHGTCGADGRCAACVPPKGDCAVLTSCCYTDVGVCEVPTGASYGTCACLPPNHGCSDDSECCDGSCLPDGPNNLPVCN